MSCLYNKENKDDSIDLAELMELYPNLLLDRWVKKVKISFKDGLMASICCSLQKCTHFLKYDPYCFEVLDLHDAPMMAAVSVGIPARVSCSLTT